MDPEDDESARRQRRQLMLSGGVVKEYQKISMTRTKGDDGETKEEYDFNSEVNLGLQAPIWKEKYKPRKPRFFNRVHTVRWQVLSSGGEASPPNFPASPSPRLTPNYIN